MSHHKYLPLLGVVLFCLTSMAGCPNKEPAGQLTVVQGRVTNVRTGRPLPAVRVALVSNKLGTRSYYQLEDTVRTDAQGAYALSFSNKQGLYYAMSCEGVANSPDLLAYRFDFADSVYFEPVFNSYITINQRTVDLTLGQKNTVNYRAAPRRVFAVQLATRQTGYQRLQLPSLDPLPADNQNRVVWLYQSVPVYAPTQQNFYDQPGKLPYATFSRTLANGLYQDTVVQVKASTPLTGDTVRATLAFGR